MYWNTSSSSSCSIHISRYAGKVLDRTMPIFLRSRRIMSDTEWITFCDDIDRAMGPQHSWEILFSTHVMRSCFANFPFYSIASVVF
mmetsp:Transcript_17305/g.32775  ORF Transcript_17305/g.32775 Transcript_17305/m.32775 type:complete len:86 (+) Transcript_17305:165-422(+)